MVEQEDSTKIDVKNAADGFHILLIACKVAIAKIALKSYHSLKTFHSQHPM